MISTCSISFAGKVLKRGAYEEGILTNHPALLSLSRLLKSPGEAMSPKQEEGGYTRGF